jgi:hypothetical protein
LIKEDDAYPIDTGEGVATRSDPAFGKGSQIDETNPITAGGA